MRFSQKILIGCSIILLFSGMLQAVETLAAENLVRALAQEVSGEKAFDYTVRISQYDRIQACEGWHDSAVMIKKEYAHYQQYQ